MRYDEKLVSPDFENWLYVPCGIPPGICEAEAGFVPVTVLNTLPAKLAILFPKEGFSSFLLKSTPCL